MSRWRKMLFVCLWITGVFVFLFLVGEVTVRLMGYQAWSPEVKTSSVQPGGSLFVPDSLLGYRLRAGAFTVTLEGRQTFETRHDADYRRAMPIPDDSLSTQKIWVLGCSFTYGWGVNGHQNWPAQLQQSDSLWQVTCLATPGYSTAQSLLQLKAALQNGEKPQIVILGFAGFHAQRNVCSRHWKKALAGQPLMEGLRYPFVTLSAGDSLQLNYTDLHFEPWRGMGFSALIHFLEIQSDLREEESLRANEVTHKLILEMNALCERENIRFIVAGVWHEGSTNRMLETIVRERVEAVEIAAPDESAFHLMPGDMHPNAVAHKLMAEKMAAYLRR